MKTLSEIIREIFSARNSKRRSIRPVPEKEMEETVINPLKNQNQDERETDEGARVSELDTADPAETNENAQESEPVETEPQEPEPSGHDGTGGAGTGGAGGECLTHGDPSPDLPTREEEVEAAYQKGLIDGRNAAIEEKYFPTKDDGIPHFRGRVSRPQPFSDIFSMAREA